MNVDFFFGPGSRYSYLASTQLDRISAETGATFRWRVALSSEVAARSGNRLLTSGQGQYTPAYRLKDVQRWAAFYDVPFVDIDSERVNWHAVVVACAAADVLGRAEPFARAFLDRGHAHGRPVDDERGLSQLAQECDLDGAQFLDAIATGIAKQRYETNLADAAAAGAFGVPSFVSEDGELFWGQDRLPLLRKHLLASARK